MSRCGKTCELELITASIGNDFSVVNSLGFSVGLRVICDGVVNTGSCFVICFGSICISNIGSSLGSFSCLGVVGITNDISVGWVLKVELIGDLVSISNGSDKNVVAVISPIVLVSLIDSVVVEVLSINRC